MLPSNVLVVDDNDLLRTVVARVLRRRGLQVFEAADAVAALAVLHGTAIDLLVTDVAMAGMNGLTMAGTMRALQPRLPVVFMSGVDVSVRNILEFGGALFLRKPFTPQSLAEVVSRLLPIAA
jgi:CheY-like chemotaxis protein